MKRSFSLFLVTLSACASLEAKESLTARRFYSLSKNGVGSVEAKVERKPIYKPLENNSFINGTPNQSEIKFDFSAISMSMRQTYTTDTNVVQSLKTESKSTNNSYHIKAAYGIYSGLYAGLSFSYMDIETTSESKFTNSSIKSRSTERAWQDPRVEIGWAKRFDNLKPILALETNIPSGDAINETKDTTLTTTESTSNGKSGGQSITPRASLEYFINSNILGIQMSYTFSGDKKITRKTENRTLDYTQRGGNSFATLIYYEYKGYVDIGGALIYNRSFAIETEMQNQISSSPGSSLSGLALYTQFKLNKNVGILPLFTYMKFMDTAVGETRIDSDENYGLGLSMVSYF